MVIILANTDATKDQACKSLGIRTADRNINEHLVNFHGKPLTNEQPTCAGNKHTLPAPTGSPFRTHGLYSSPE